MKLRFIILYTFIIFVSGIIVGRNYAKVVEHLVFVEHQTAITIPLPKAYKVKDVQRMALAIPALALEETKWKKK